MTSPFRRLATPPANRTLRTRLHTTLLEDRTVPATFTVTDLGDAGAGTLRDAITQANANPDADTIVFGTTGTITLASEIDITESVTITGAGTVTLDGGGTNRIFEINNAASLLNVTLSGLTFQNGAALGADGGAILVSDDENLTIRDSVFTGNTATEVAFTGGDGGALYFAGGVLQIFNTTFSQNDAANAGGAIYVDNGTMLVQDSVFTGNTSGADGGALYAGELYGGVFTGTTFSGNTAGDGGGAITFYGINASILIDDCDITGNTATNSGGGLYANSFYYGSTLTIANSTITGNTAGGDGGGVYFGDSDGTLKIISSTISNNTAADDGGGVYFENDSEAAVIEITDSSITGNTATAGVGGGVHLYLDEGTANFTDTVITGNTAGDSGGGLAIFQNNTDLDGKVTIVGSTISGNTAANDGGGVLWSTTSSSNTGDLIIRDSNISGNVATTGDGGGVWIETGDFYGTILLEDTTITGNTADGRGGGLGLDVDDFYSQIRIVGSTISGNTATTGEGGGVFLLASGFYGGVLISESTISGNTAGTDGGGVYFYDDEADAALTIESSTISGNTAADDGGGIWFYSDDGLLVVKNSTVSGNTATAGDGGGIYIDESNEAVQLLNSTIVFNTAGTAGGGISTNSGDVRISSSIISGNTAPDGNDLEGDGSDFYATFSLIGNTTIGGTSTLTDLGFNLFGVDPLLGPLADNGGPTFTHALLRGSPAINFGFNFAGTLYDQRGQPFLRTFGDATDIGAFEFQLPPPEPIVAGAGAGGSGEFVVYNLDGTERARITAFDPSVTGGVRVATADVTGDGVYDYIVGAGPGAPSLVKIYDGESLNQIAILIAFEISFTGGVYVAGGDLDGDGFAEVVVTPDQGGGPVVAVYDGEALAGGSVVELARFLGIQDDTFRGGARVAVGDVTGDGLADIVVAAGFEGGPRVTVWSGAAVVAGGAGLDATPYANFFAFEDTLRNGTFVAVGDLDGDGFGDVIVGAGPGGGPRVVVFDGADLATGTLTETASFFAGDESLRNGVPVAVADLNGDTEIDVVAGVGEPAAGTTGSPATVRVYSASSLTDDPLNPIATLDPFPGFTGGVFVG